MREVCKREIRVSRGKPTRDSCDASVYNAFCPERHTSQTTDNDDENYLQ